MLGHERRSKALAKLTNARCELEDPERALDDLTPMVSVPVEDILCTDDAYQELYQQAGLNAVCVLKPLAKGDEACRCVNQTKIPTGSPTC